MVLAKVNLITVLHRLFTSTRVKVLVFCFRLIRRGKVSIKDMNQHGKEIASAQINGQAITEVYTLQVKVTPLGNNQSQLLLTVKPQDTTKGTVKILAKIDSHLLAGNLALVSHPGPARKRGAKKGKSYNAARYAFSNWEGSGERIVENAKGKIGAIISSQYTLSNQVMKITAQLMPIAESQAKYVFLQTKKDGQWQNLQISKILRPSLTAPFRVKNWDDTKATDYRFVYTTKNDRG